MGMGTSVSTAVSERTAVIIEDYMFDATVAGELTPEESPSDFHDTWDLDGTDFMPETSPDDEGYWDDLPNVVLNGDYEELGSELVSSGTFSGFSVESGDVTISGNTASYVDSGGNANSRVTLASVLTANKMYKVIFDVTRYASGRVQFIFGGGNTVDVDISAGVGTYTAHVLAGGSTSISVKRDGSYSGFDFDLTNISVKQVDPNDRWTLGTGWTISGGTANVASGSDGAALSQDICQVGVVNRVVFTISNYTGSGFVRLRTGDASQVQDFSANGTYTFDVVPTSVSFSFARYVTGSLSIDNVSVKEYAITPLDV